MNTISAIKLKATFGPDWKYIITQGQLKQIPGSRTYEILADLPTVEAYAKLRDSKHSCTVGGLIEDAKSEIESLASEMQDWADGMPESLQGGSKYDEVTEAQNALESVSLDEFDTKINDLKLIFHPDYEKESRSSRANEVVSMLRAAATRLEEEATSTGGATDEEDSELDGLLADLKTAAEHLNEVADEVEGVNFPGAY